MLPILHPRIVPFVSVVQVYRLHTIARLPHKVRKRYGFVTNRPQVFCSNEDQDSSIPKLFGDLVNAPAPEAFPNRINVRAGKCIDRSTLNFRSSFLCEGMSIEIGLEGRVFNRASLSVSGTSSKMMDGRKVLTNPLILSMNCFLWSRSSWLGVVLSRH
jgi:hypothetical protein